MSMRFHAFPTKMNAHATSARYIPATDTPKEGSAIVMYQCSTEAENFPPNTAAANNS